MRPRTAAAAAAPANPEPPTARAQPPPPAHQAVCDGALHPPVHVAAQLLDVVLARPMQLAINPIILGLLNLLGKHPLLAPRRELRAAAAG